MTRIRKISLRSFFTAFFMLTAISCSGNANTGKLTEADLRYISEYNSFKGIKVGKPYKIKDQWFNPKHQPRYTQVGMASWYGPNVGARTANGEVFDTYELTAAHPTLPLPSIVEVTNLDTGKKVVVRVNDRGPFHSKRIIDVSKAAAQQLGMLNAGTAKVKVELLQEATLQYLKQTNQQASN